MSYNLGNTGFKVGGTGFTSTGLSLISAANAGAARSTLGLDVGDSPVFTNLKLTGNLEVQGARLTVGGEISAFADNYVILNNAYTADAAQTVGMVASYDPTTVTTTVNGSYVAGVASTSNPTIATTGAATFAAGDIIQITGSTANNGFFEVQSHASNVLTIKGIGTVAAVEDFSQNQLTAGSSDSAAITKVNVSVIRVGTDGLWEVGKGASVPLSYVDISTAAPYVAGNGLTLTGSTFDVGAGNGISVLADSVQIQLDGTTMAVGPSGLKINTSGVGTNELGANVVTQAKMAANSVGAAEIIDGAVGTNELANGSVTQAKHAANSVGSPEIIDGSVGTAELANTAVTPAKADLSQAWTHTGLLSAQGGFAAKVTVSTTNITVGATDTVVAITDTTAARTVTLPAVSGNTGRVVVIKDATGAAATNNITVDGNAAETIDGAATYAINTNYGSVTLVADVGGWYVV